MLRVAEQAFSSDTGQQRTANEDSFYAQAPVFAVADGMGGAQAGEVASRIAVESFAPATRSAEAPEAYLRRIAETANQRIHSHAQQDSSHSGMGTTLTAAMLDGDEVSFAHVGDSRAYLWRAGELRLLTSDHSLVEELRRQGRLTDEQAEDHPQRSIITRALGPESEVEIDTLTFSARPGDVFVLCSDGLTTMVKDAGIAAIMAGSQSLEQAVTALVAAANEAGGRDNITVVAFRVETADDRAVEEGATLIGPSAEEAGLTGERVRAAAARQRTDRRPQPAAPKRSRWRTVAKTFAVLVVIAAIGFGAWFGLRQVYFLGIDEGGRVTVYRGLPYDLPLGVELYSEYRSGPFQASSVPEVRQDQITDHNLRSQDDALSLLDSLETDATAPTDTTPSNPPGNTNSNDNGGSSGGQNGHNPGGSQSGGAGSRRPPRSGDRTRGQSGNG